jgi:hypothetical protein
MGSGMPMQKPYIDQSVYPDTEPPETLDTELDRADYVERVCAAWDFDVLPEQAAFDLFRGWKKVFDDFPLPHSPAYHTFRGLFGWEDVPFPPGGSIVHCTYLVLDRLEGRGPDPCENMV